MEVKIESIVVTKGFIVYRHQLVLEESSSIAGSAPTQVVVAAAAPIRSSSAGEVHHTAGPLEALKALQAAVAVVVAHSAAAQGY